MLRLWLILLLLLATTVSMTRDRVTLGMEADSQEAPCDFDDDSDDSDDDWVSEPHLTLITVESRIAAQAESLAHRHVPAPVHDRPPSPFVG
jgi:hypothetical protein